MKNLCLEIPIILDVNVGNATTFTIKMIALKFESKFLHSLTDSIQLCVYHTLSNKQFLTLRIPYYYVKLCLFIIYIPVIFG